MARTNTDFLKYPTQDWSAEVRLTSARQFRLADVGPFGTDQGDLHTYPPEPDIAVPYDGPVDFRNIKVAGDITGSVESGGFQGAFTIQDVDANLPDFAGFDLWLRTWHGNVAGVIGAAGTADQARLFRGYVQSIRPVKDWKTTGITFTVMGSQQFLTGSSFSRGIDWAPGLGHSGPISMNEILDHLIRYHTNIPSRAEFGIYVPDNTLERFSLNQGSIRDMMMGCLYNSIEGWVYFDREDNLQVRCHPNLCPEAWAAELADPIIDFDEGLVMNWDTPEVNGQQAASVTLQALTADLTSLTVIRYSGEGLGSRDSVQNLRYESEAPLNRLAELYMNHANRRFPSITIQVPLNIAADLGNIVSCTYKNEYRNIDWKAKPFVVKGISYSINSDKRQFSSSLTLDEVVV